MGFIKIVLSQSRPVMPSAGIGPRASSGPDPPNERLHLAVPKRGSMWNEEEFRMIELERRYVETKVPPRAYDRVGEAND